VGAKRLKADPESIDFILAASLLARQQRGNHAGYYALAALSRLLEKNLPGETGPIEAMNIRRRLDRLIGETEFPAEIAAKVYENWRPIRPFLEKKISMVPSHRMRRIRLFVELVAWVFENYARVPVSEVVREMTVADLARLEQGFGFKVRETKQKKREFQGFALADFDDLLRMRKRLDEAAGALGGLLGDRGGLRLGPSLSAVDYTSSWVALTWWDNPLGEPDGEAGFRVMATTETITAGFFLGAESTRTRERYYRRLGSGELAGSLERFAGAGGTFFDFFWTCNQDERRPIDAPEQLRPKIEETLAELASLPPPYPDTPLLPGWAWTREEAAGMRERILPLAAGAFGPCAALTAALAGQ